MLVNDRQEFAEELRSQLDAAIKPQLIALIEEVGGICVKTLLTDTNLSSEISGIIAILGSPPPVRDLESIPKLKKEKKVESGSE